MMRAMTTERPGWAAPPRASNGELTREEFEAKATSYLVRLREGRQLSSESQNHMDRMFTWAIGLMGAGIFLSPNFFQALSVSHCPQWLLLVVLSPWVIGIMIALAGRLFISKWQGAENVFAQTKLAAVERLLLSQEPARLSQELLDIISNKSQRYELGHRMARLQRYGRMTAFFYYSAHLALGIGILAVVGFVSLGRFCG
jgi:hypothetical protein